MSLRFEVCERVRVPPGFYPGMAGRPVHQVTGPSARGSIMETWGGPGYRVQLDSGHVIYVEPYVLQQLDVIELIAEAGDR